MDFYTLKFLVVFTLFPLISPEMVKWATIAASRMAFELFPYLKNIPDFKKEIDLTRPLPTPDIYDGSNDNGETGEQEESWWINKPSDKDTLQLVLLTNFHSKRKFKELKRVISGKKEFCLLTLPSGKNIVIHHWAEGSEPSEPLENKWWTNTIVCCHPECLGTFKNFHLVPKHEGPLGIEVFPNKTYGFVVRVYTIH